MKVTTSPIVLAGLLAVLSIVLVLSGTPSGAREGGDLSVCRVNVEEDRLTMAAGPRIVLGDRGEAVCLAFLQYLSSATDHLPSSAPVEVGGGDGLTIESPISISTDEQNPATPLLRHFRMLRIGKWFDSFDLISRPHDRYVLAVTAIDEAGTERFTRYYEMTDWVISQLGPQ